MQNNRSQSRWNFIDPAYAASPRIFHWLANTLGVISLAAPYLTVLIPWFAAVWGADQLQIVLGSAAYGMVSAGMAMIESGATLVAVGMLVTTYQTRREWEEVVRRIIYDACEEFLQPWLR